eukprot:m.464747 g.464747  ORF g.464747 m.464747 type:complete len:387 (+) comp20357_c1_seq3:81-1241(+)
MANRRCDGFGHDLRLVPSVDAAAMSGGGGGSGRVLSGGQLVGHQLAYETNGNPTRPPPPYLRLSDVESLLNGSSSEGHAQPQHDRIQQLEQALAAERAAKQQAEMDAAAERVARQQAEEAAAAAVAAAAGKRDATFSKLRAFLRKYTKSMLTARRKTELPTRNLQLNGTPSGFGNCIICEQRIMEGMFELMNCGHVVCGSTSMNRGGCGRLGEAQTHKTHCRVGPFVAVRRHIKLHGMYSRAGSSYQHVDINDFTEEETGYILDDFRAAIKAFLVAHHADGDVTVEIRNGCIELAATFTGRQASAEAFAEFFSLRNVELLFPPEDFNLSTLTVCSGPSVSSASSASSMSSLASAPSVPSAPSVSPHAQEYQEQHAVHVDLRVRKGA